MCGICGIIWKQSNIGDESTILRMNRAMIHRGPDDEGYFTDQNTQIAMRRLSIIDLAGGHQPITTPDGRYTIVFNGEIYNYNDIREELLGRGHTFETRSDTETILMAFAEWGADCVHRLRGMFAFAIWDAAERSMFIARDRLGIKPLLFIETPQYFAFSSELKSLMQAPDFPKAFDYEALHHLLSFQAIPTPMHLFKNVRSIPAGWRGWYRNGEWKTDEYWDVTFAPDTHMTETDAVDGLDRLIGESVDMRLMSEVPLGAFLSGGVDSSLVVAMMANRLGEPVKTFNISWGDEHGEFNEIEHAHAVASRYNTEHYEHVVGVQDLIGELPRIIWAYDQPTPSAFQTYFVSKFTRQHVTVALSGLGGDEIAAGYPFFHAYHEREQRLKRLMSMPKPLRRLLGATFPHLPGAMGRLGRGMRDTTVSPGTRYSEHRLYTGIEAYIRSTYTDAVAARSGGADTGALIASIIDRAPSDEIVNRIAYHELRRYMLDDPLTDTDRCSMAHSLEVRVPLIDHKLVEFAGTIPAGLKVHSGVNKYLLKRLAERYLPHETIYRTKKGFSIPLVDWVPGPLAPILDKVLSPESVKARGLFRPEAVQQLRARASSSRERSIAGHIWNLAVIELWMRIYIDGDGTEPVGISTEDLIERQPAISLG